MDDVQGDVLWPPHGTTPHAEIANKIKPRSYKSSDEAGIPFEKKNTNRTRMLCV